jgi:hypothetical protein
MPKAKNQSRHINSLVVGEPSPFFCFFFEKKEDWGSSVVFASFSKRRFLGEGVVSKRKI